MLSKKKTSWVEKLNDSKGLPKVEKITDKMSKRWGINTIVIPAPIEVDEIMRKVPPGNLITINEIRSALARKHKATIGCPMTTGIFAWVAAHAAEKRWREKHHALLAHPENRRCFERKISWRSRSAKAELRKGRPYCDHEGQKIRCAKLRKSGNSNLN